MSERYGQGQSRYGAGRHGEDRSPGLENRNQGYGGRFEDRQQQGMGLDDRFSGRGGQGYYQGGREGYGRQDGGLGQRGFGPSGYDQRGNEGREGYGIQGLGLGRSGSYGQPRVYGVGLSGGSLGYRWGQGNQGYGGSSSFNSMFGSSTQSGFGQEMRGHRGKGPQNWQRSDERIRDLICETLTDDDHIDASNIDISVTSGDVTLTGQVPDRLMKRLAEDIVERVSGVKDVVNQLKVQQDRGNPSMNRGVGKNESDSSDRSKHRA